MMPAIHIVARGVAAAVLVACCAGTANAALHPGDRVSISVYNHPELSLASTAIDAAGSVSMPLVGSVAAAGIEPDQLAVALRRRLQTFVPRAAVDVRLIEQTQDIFVTGDRGGILKYAPGETLVAALQQIPAHGGEAGTAAAADLRHGSIELHDIRIKRNSTLLGPFDVDAMIARGESGPALMPGDTLRLSQKPIRVRVTGAVKQPGTAYLDRDEPLANALVQVGGELPTAWTSRVHITRDDATHVVALGGAAFAEPARNGDSIDVPRAPHVEVLGLVVKPGDTTLHGDASLLGALYEAGGPQNSANLRSVAVLHGGVRREFDLQALTHGANQNNPPLADGDTVFVPQGHRLDASLLFQIIGAATGLRFFR